MEGRIIPVLSIIPGVVVLITVAFYIMMSMETTTSVLSVHGGLINNDKDPHVQDDTKLKSCKPHNHVFFVKVPKTGGSTLSNILHRLIEKYKLVISLGYNKVNKQFPKYDMHTSHKHYDEQAVIDYFPNDTKVITLIRHPYTMMKSAIYFFNHISLDGYNETSILENGKFNEAFQARAMITTVYLDIDVKRAGENNEYFQQELDNINKKFELVVINERYDEGLVLLKRKMCWDMKDILYLTLKPQVYPESYKLLDNSDFLKDKYKEISLDYKLYDYFSNVFDAKITTEKSFQDEVNYFQESKKKVSKFCEEVLSHLIVLKDFEKMKIHIEKKITVKASEFNNQFIVKGSDCVLMTTMLGCFTSMIKTRMHENLSPSIKPSNSMYARSNSENFLVYNLPYKSFKKCNEAEFGSVKYVRNKK